MGAGASALTHTSDPSSADAKLRAALAVKLHVAGGAGVTATDTGNRQRVEAAFRAADLNGDGRIDGSEFSAAAASIGGALTELRIAALGRLRRYPWAAFFICQ